MHELIQSALNSPLVLFIPISIVAVFLLFTTLFCWALLGAAKRADKRAAQITAETKRQEPDPFEGFVLPASAGDLTSDQYPAYERDEVLQ